MININIKDHYGKEIGGREAGQRLRLFLEDNWSSTDRFEVDFDQNKIASISFFDEVFGKLVFKYAPSELKTKLVLKNIDPLDKELLNSVINDRSKGKNKTDENLK
ncbi:MAG: STAS-like domain-containing protein [Candidatus Omnitrophota bacterium]